MKRSLLLLFAMALLAMRHASLLQAETNYETARAALLAGDARRAESMLSGSGEAASLRLLGEARELQGDLKGAASAYARAAAKLGAGPEAKFLNQRAVDMQQIEAQAAAQLKSTPTAQATTVPTQAPTPEPTIASTSLATAPPTRVPTTAATTQVTPDAAAAEQEAARAALAKEREALEREKMALAEEKKKLAEEKVAAQGGKRRGNQGFRILAGAGSHWSEGVQVINDFANNGAQTGNSGPRAVHDIAFPYNFGIGLRWAGVLAELTMQELTAEYEAQVGLSTQLRMVALRQETFGLGYDWVLFSLGSGARCTEFLLPLRLEYAHAVVNISGLEADSSNFGPALGLGFRWLMSEDFSLEGSVLYHVAMGDSQIAMPDPSTLTYSGMNQYKSNLSQDGPEARMRLGWRVF